MSWRRMIRGVIAAATAAGLITGISGQSGLLSGASSTNAPGFSGGTTFAAAQNADGGAANTLEDGWLFGPYPAWILNGASGNAQTIDEAFNASMFASSPGGVWNGGASGGASGSMNLATFFGDLASFLASIAMNGPDSGTSPTELIALNGGGDTAAIVANGEKVASSGRSPELNSGDAGTTSGAGGSGTGSTGTSSGTDSAGTGGSSAPGGSTNGSAGSSGSGYSAGSSGASGPLNGGLLGSPGSGNGGGGSNTSGNSGNSGTGGSSGTGGVSNPESPVDPGVAAAVPEASSLSLLLAGGCGMGFFAWRRRRV